MAEALQPLTPLRPADPLARPRRASLLRYAPPLTLSLFLLPIAAGLIGTWIPAFGYLPALGGTTFSLTPWEALFAHPSLPGALRLTLISGILATLISLFLVIAFVASCHQRPIFYAFRRWLSPLLSVPHVSLAIGLAFLIAPSGWMVRALSPWATGWEIPPDLPLVQDPYGVALTLGLVLKETPFLFLMILAALPQAQADERLAVARSLGYGPVTAWIKTVLPAVYRQIRLPVFAVLAFSLSVVDMALVLAPLSPPPLAVLIFRWFNDPDLSMRFLAAAGAALQFLLVAGTIGLWWGAEKAVARLGRIWLRRGDRGGSGFITRAIATGGIGLVCLLSAAALLGMALWSVAQRWRYPETLPSSWSLTTWERQVDGLLWAGYTTMLTGAAAAGLAVILVLACLENETRHGLRTSSRALWLLYTPLLVPQVGFLFGVQVLTARFGLDGTWLALVWSHHLFVLPYVFLSLADPYRALDERYVRTALCLGLSPARVFWRVKVPMLLRPLLFAVAIGFAVSVAQYLPTVFAGGGRFVTLTTEAVSLAGGADRRVMGVYAILQALFPLLGFAIAFAVPAILFGSRQQRRVTA